MNRYRRPPYIDPQTNVHFDTSGPEFEGWLTKRSAWLQVSVTTCAVSYSYQSYSLTEKNSFLMRTS